LQDPEFRQITAGYLPVNSIFHSNLAKTVKTGNFRNATSILPDYFRMHPEASNSHKPGLKVRPTTQPQFSGKRDRRHIARLPDRSGIAESGSVPIFSSSLKTM
jgi:hypothetical protein